MVYLIFSIIVASFSLAIIRDRDTFFNYLVRIEIFSVVSLIFMLIPARAVNRFFAVFLAFAKSLP